MVIEKWGKSFKEFLTAYVSGHTPPRVLINPSIGPVRSSLAY